MRGIWVFLIAAGCGTTGAFMGIAAGLALAGAPADSTAAAPAAAPAICPSVPDPLPDQAVFYNQERMTYAEAVLRAKADDERRKTHPSSNGWKIVRAPGDDGPIRNPNQWFEYKGMKMPLVQAQEISACEREKEAAIELAIEQANAAFAQQIATYRFSEQVPQYQPSSAYLSDLDRKIQDDAARSDLKREIRNTVSDEIRRDRLLHQND